MMPLMIFIPDMTYGRVTELLIRLLPAGKNAISTVTMIAIRRKPFRKPNNPPTSLLAQLKPAILKILPAVAPKIDADIMQAIKIRTKLIILAVPDSILFGIIFATETYSFKEIIYPATTPASVTSCLIIPFHNPRAVVRPAIPRIMMSSLLIVFSPFRFLFLSHLTPPHHYIMLSVGGLQASTFINLRINLRSLFNPQLIGMMNVGMFTMLFTVKNEKTSDKLMRVLAIDNPGTGSFLHNFHDVPYF